MPEKSNFDHNIRLALRELMMRCGKSRAQVAEELSQRLGRTVTENVLTNWASDSKTGYRVPADVVAALQDDGLLRSLMNRDQLSKFDLGGWALKHTRLEGKPLAEWKRASRKRREVRTKDP